MANTNMTNHTDSNSPAYKSSAAREALNQYKYEVANELGVNLKQGYNGELTSREAGSIGGEMVKRMIQSQEQKMSGQ
ncbi:alpha/beta-type small acid-soluble spore protein [Vallitalea okinawensis]|uniref:alpha/beta-type small acid-soluble spore protein n=1 Tax=Vallitalea okinawensis TaxID=2078660 RepID=UPI001478EEE9|nr:alpha/beta-type small acid-soluble spore protein [Vallitalea okinawensis]